MFFLSASIPDPQRDRRYFETADTIAIRDAVKALATVVIPHSLLVWGGHPAISPLIYNVLSSMNASANEHVLLYQSDFFSAHFPKENKNIARMIVTEKKGTREESLYKMRMQMLYEDGHKFMAGIFIGGMEGVEVEFEFFTKYNKKSIVLPIASTGGAARIIYDKMENPNPRLMNDYTYMDLFRSLLPLT